MSLLRITGGTLYDPANGIDDQVRDLWVRDGKIVEPPAGLASPPTPALPHKGGGSPQAGAGDDWKPDRTFDARGMIVMPGGIDIHCHIAGPKVNTARKMRPEEKRKSANVRRTPLTRSGTLGSVPSTFATGYKYAGLGYTTAFDAAIPPLSARHAHEELHDTPIIDKGFYVLVGNNHYIMDRIRDAEPERLRNYLGWLLNAAKGYAAKLVNPGGVEVWKEGGGDVAGLDSPVEYFQVTPRQIITAVARAAEELRLPHPVHIHCNNLGIPGNWRTTLQTMRALEGRRGHLTHVQFHSYGGGTAGLSTGGGTAGLPSSAVADGDDRTFTSKVPELADYINAHPNLSVDVGQVLFGETTSMTGDGPLGYYLHRVTGRKWFSADTEMETGCGIVPITYCNKSLVHALQWAIGLEWYLLVEDPWRVVMSTDHPNGGSFLAYPEIIQLLMDRSYRDEMLATVPERVRGRCTLPDLDRQYSLYEIAIITRAAPARILGLKHKGHLGPGADADITIYSRRPTIRETFELPRYVFKAGRLVVEDGEIRAHLEGRTLHVVPAYDEAAVDHIREWFENYYTIQFANYPVDASYLHDHVAVECA